MNISVVLPVKSGIEFVDKCILNLRRSLSDKDEVLIICNGASDSLISRIQTSIVQDSRFKVFILPNIGLVNALNFGVDVATNDWIFRVDIDDDYSESRFKVQRKFIEANPGVVAWFSDYRFIDRDNRDLGYVATAIYPSLVAISLLSGIRTPHPIVAFCKKAFLEVGGYRKTDFPAEDLSLWLRLINVGSISSIPIDLLHYRIHSASVSSQNRRLSRETAQKLFSEFRLPEELLINLNMELNSISRKYLGFTHFGDRLLLLAYDLLLLRAHGYISTFRLCTYLWKLRNPYVWLFIKSAIHLVLGQRVRSKYRRER